MFTHCVFFWLKEGTSDPDKTAFERGLASLVTIPGALHGAFGIPAATDRPVVERSYSYGLMIQFADRGAHDAYQVHPIHNEFLANHSSLFARVQVFDFVDPPRR